MRLPRLFGALLPQLVEELGGTHEIGEEECHNPLGRSRFPGIRPEWVGRSGASTPRAWMPVEFRIVAQHGALQMLESRAGLDAELLPEGRSKLLVGAEGIGLAPCPVEGGDPLTPKPLPQRVCSGENLELGGHLTVPPAGQVGV